MSIEERSGMEQKRCRACRKLFHPRAQCPGQQFCSAPACQRERKRRWQKARRATDPDYRDNDIQANHQWRRQHPDYWRSYRSQHPRAVMRNRDQQRQRDHAKRVRPPPAADLANENVSKRHFTVETGTYQLFRVTGRRLANEDACLVKIALLS